jgi:hypothetical protein
VKLVKGDNGQLLSVTKISSFNLFNTKQVSGEVLVDMKSVLGEAGTFFAVLITDFVEIDFTDFTSDEHGKATSVWNVTFVDSQAHCIVANAEDVYIELYPLL